MNQLSVASTLDWGDTWVHPCVEGQCQGDLSFLGTTGLWYIDARLLKPEKMTGEREGVVLKGDPYYSEGDLQV